MVYLQSQGSNNDRGKQHGGGSWVGAEPGQLIGSRTLEEWFTWLDSRSDDHVWCGWDAAGWEASTWVLNAMYENPDLEAETTHDDLHRERLAAGLEEPTLLDTIGDEHGLVMTGGALGMSGLPDENYVRLKWKDLAKRLGIVLGDNQYPPCFRWFPYRSWPLSLWPADEGSLDRATLNQLITRIGRTTNEGLATPCIACYAAGTTADYVPWMAPFALGELGELIETGPRDDASPSNWWAADETWMVYTDWDLWATRVSGSRQLIDALIADDQLETVEWPLKS